MTFSPDTERIRRSSTRVEDEAFEHADNDPGPLQLPGRPEPIFGGDKRWIRRPLDAPLNGWQSGNGKAGGTKRPYRAPRAKRIILESGRRLWTNPVLTTALVFPAVASTIISEASGDGLHQKEFAGGYFLFLGAEAVIATVFSTGGSRGEESRAKKAGKFAREHWKGVALTAAGLGIVAAAATSHPSHESTPNTPATTITTHGGNQHNTKPQTRNVACGAGQVPELIGFSPGVKDWETSWNTTPQALADTLHDQGHKSITPDQVADWNIDIFGQDDVAGHIGMTCVRIRPPQ